MQIDCYGFEASSQWFRRKELEVYLMKEVEGILYLCYENQPMRPIALGLTATLKSHSRFSADTPCGPPRRGGSRFARRFLSKTRRNTAAFSSAHSRIDHDEHGCTRESWAFGRWADVESLRYIPVNQTMEIDAKDWEAT